MSALTRSSSFSRSSSLFSSSHMGDYGSGEVENPLQFLGGNIQQVAHATGHTLEIPDVADRGSKIYVAHALTTHLGTSHLHPTTFALYALVADTLILAAVALPILGGTEDTLTEKTILLRLERPIIDGLRLEHFTGRPRPHLVFGSESYLDRVEIIDIYQGSLLFFLVTSGSG